jgi:hypothetical protein
MSQSDEVFIFQNLDVDQIVIEYQSTCMSGGSASKQTLLSPNGTTTGPPSMKQDPIPSELCETCIHGIEVCNAYLPVHFFPK